MEIKIKKSELDTIIMTSFEATKKSLEEARKFAMEHRDVDALIAISDRWAATTERAYKIKTSDKGAPTMGFITVEESNDETEH